MTQNHKHQILESLDAMDQEQAEHVLDYIKSMLNNDKQKPHYQKMKREAMREIRLVLNSKRKFNTAF